MREKFEDSHAPTCFDATRVGSSPRVVTLHPQNRHPAAGSHPAFKVMQEEADAEAGERIELADMDFSLGFVAGLIDRNGDVRGIGSSEGSAAVPQVYGCRMIPIPCAIGNGNRKSSQLPRGDRLIDGSLKVPQSVEALWARTVIHEGELKALLKPPGLPDHGCC